jgi:hypothetical protein
MNLLEQETRPIIESTRLIPLTLGKYAIVDASDYEWLMQRKWYAVKDPKADSHYVLTYHPFRTGEKRLHMRMHRYIMGLDFSDPRRVDHRNHNPLDNRRENLRVCTVTENNRNVRKNRTNTSGYKGVRMEAGKWRVRIRFNGKKLHVGFFLRLEDAIKAYRQAAFRYHGEFACLE